ncbi:MAG: Gfo/Idh/MocA family oxidoreductase [Clostridia bacterium]|nr:Gfo/Idh/MocA family oxidoreductase [Clostridia bacterium]
MEQLKVGLVGLGGQGRAHAKALLQAQQKENYPCKLAAVCDVRPEQFETIEVEFNIKESSSVLGFKNYPCYTDVDEMIAKEKLDLVIIAIPTYLHCETAVKFLKAGIHVLCEKPMALDVEQCDEMIRVAKENGKQLMIGQCLRFWDEYRILKSYIDSGELGAVRAGMFYRGSDTPKWSFRDWYMHKALGGGAVFDQHIHDVDMVQYLFGMPNGVSTNGKIIYEDTNYDTVCTNYIYTNGPLVFSHNDWTLSCGFAHGYRVNFERATLEMGAGGLILSVRGKDPERVEFTRSSALSNEVEYFAECILGKRVNDINTPENSRDTIRLVTAEIASANQGAAVVHP